MRDLCYTCSAREMCESGDFYNFELCEKYLEKEINDSFGEFYSAWLSYIEEYDD